MVEITAPEGVNERVKEIYELHQIGNQYFLSGYKEIDLLETLNLLKKSDQKKMLRNAIKKELAVRKKAQVKKSSSNRDTLVWFTPLWWAVMSLFDKGGVDKNSPYTKLMLNRIKPEWAKRTE